MADTGEKLTYVRKIELKKQPIAVLRMFDSMNETLERAGVTKDQVFRNPEEKDENLLLLDCQKLDEVIAGNPLLSTDQQLKDKIAFSRRYLFASLKSTLSMKNIRNRDPLFSGNRWSMKLDALAKDAPYDLKNTPLNFSPRYTAMLIVACKERPESFDELVGILRRKADILDAGHVGDLLRMAAHNIDHIQLAPFINLIESKAESVKGGLVEELLLLATRAKPADSHVVAEALVKLIANRNPPRLRKEHLQLLANLGVKLDR